MRMRPSDDPLLPCNDLCDLRAKKPSATLETPGVALGWMVGREGLEP